MAPQRRAPNATMRRNHREQGTQRARWALAAVAWLVAGVLVAQDDPEHYGPKPTAAPKAKAQYEANLKACKGNPDKLVLPGLVADRKARSVEVLVESTGLRAEEAVEFLLVDQASSHGYEALLWSFAKPSDVHRALEFIGLKPAAPRNPAVPRLWSDGDRVTLEINDGGNEAFPIERLILDKETGRTLPEEGFVFAGSMMVPPPDGKGAARYAADVYDPRSVASIYNEPAALLDVPREASQGELYGRQVVNPEAATDGGTVLTVVMKPADPDGRARPRQLRLSLDCAAPTGLVCRLSEPGGAVLGEASSITPVLEKLAALRKDAAAPGIELSFAEAVPVRDVGKTCMVMAMVESMGMAGVKPPAAGELYYRAFVPDKRWMKPEGRPSQPWELHLRRGGDGRATGELVLHQEVLRDGQTEPVYERTTSAVSTPAAVRAKLDADAQERRKTGASPLPAVLLVYAPGAMRYGEVAAFVRPVLDTHGTVYVFVEE